MNKEQYYRDLAEIQKQHLQNVVGVKNENWRPCMHDACASCHGTGVRIDGSLCIHCISCPCPKCSPSSM